MGLWAIASSPVPAASAQAPALYPARRGLLISPRHARRCARDALKPGTAVHGCVQIPNSKSSAAAWPCARRTAMLTRRLTSFAIAAVLAAGFATLSPLPAPAQDQSITVFAAASMKNALDDINAAYTKKTGIKVVTSYAASSALIKQIESGAPADVFASADLDWMDYGAQKKLIKD